MTIVKHSKRTLRKSCTKCGQSGLYWGHDTSVPGSRGYCNDCDTDGKWLLLEGDGITPHILNCNGSGPVQSEPSEDERNDAKPPVAVPSPSPVGVGPDAFAAFQTMMAALTPQLDRETVVSLIRDELAGVVFPTRTVVLRPDGTAKPIDGASHYKTGDVLTDLMAGEHVMMVGPAGTGKSTIAEQCAEGMGLPYYSISLSPQMPESRIMGYMQAAGEYVRTPFRDAYENGGVFHFDEIDNSHPSTLAVVNAALANGTMAFPDGMVKRHADFRCVASANTYGKGADRAYVGRQAIDAATLDRFAIETIEIDEALEQTLCMGTGARPETVTDVLRFVRKLRKNAADKKMMVVMSPRASVGMCRLLAAGKAWPDAVEARARRGMSDTDWSKLNGGS